MFFKSTSSAIVFLVLMTKEADTTFLH